MRRVTIAMVEFITTLKAKSRTVRQYYAFGFAALFTLVLGVIWVSTLPARLTILNPEPPVIESEVAVVEAVIAPVIVQPEAPSRFAAWRDQLASVFGSWQQAPAVAEPPPQPEAPVMPWNEFREASRESPNPAAQQILIGTTSGATTTAVGESAPDLPRSSSTATSGAVLQ